MLHQLEFQEFLKTREPQLGKVEQFYTAERTSLLNSLLHEIGTIQGKIDRQKPFQSAIWNTIQEKLRIEWTYDSNALEGSTLSREETYFFLREGLTVEGRRFKNFLDTRNHMEAIEHLYESLQIQRLITPELLKEFHSLLLTGILRTESIDDSGEPIQQKVTPGAYRQSHNHILQNDGTIFYYRDPLQIPADVEQLCDWIQNHLPAEHPVIIAATAHYNLLRIHPFDDANGRIGRLLMNLILIKYGYPPAIIKNEQKRQYLQAIRQADQSHLEEFIELVAHNLLNVQQGILVDLNNTL